MANIQIPERLFYDLFRLAELDNPPPELRKRCQEGLRAKLDKMAVRDIYTRSKTALDAQERATARTAYLERRGVREEFRS